MNQPAGETLSVVVERELPYPPEKIWRALTQPHLIAEWLMKNDFKPAVGHQFSLRMDPQPNWNGVIDCQVLVVEPNKTLSYTWGALGLESAVTFTLTPTQNRHASAHGADRLPARSAAKLPGRQVRLAEVLCQPGAGPGAR